MNHLRRQSSCNSAQHKDIMPETTIWSHGRARHGHGHGQQQQQQQHVGRYTALPVRQSQPQRAGHRTPDTGQVTPHRFISAEGTLPRALPAPRHTLPKREIRRRCGPPWARPLRTKQQSSRAALGTCLPLLCTRQAKSRTLAHSGRKNVIPTRRDQPEPALSKHDTLCSLAPSGAGVSGQQHEAGRRGARGHEAVCCMLHVLVWRFPWHRDARGWGALARRQACRRPGRSWCRCAVGGRV
jgi:hypothetical protein